MAQDSKAMAMDVIQRALAAQRQQPASGVPGSPPEAVPPAPAPAPPPQDDPGSRAGEPAAVVADAGTEQRVPYDRFATVTAENQELRTGMESLRTELLELKRQQADVDAATALRNLTRPDGFDSMPAEDQNAWLSQQLARGQVEARVGPLEKVLPRIEALLLADEAQTTFPDLTRSQAGLVAEVRKSAPNLSIEDALAVARQRKPDVFNSNGVRKVPAPPPVSHGVQNPSPTGSQNVSTPTVRELMGASVNAPRGSRMDAIKAVMRAHRGNR